MENLTSENKCTTSPVRYYRDGEPYVIIAGAEVRNHPVVKACAYLDRLEKYVIPELQTQLAQVTAERDAAVESACTVWRV